MILRFYWSKFHEFISMEMMFGAKTMFDMDIHTWISIYGYPYMGSQGSLGGIHGYLGGTDGTLGPMGPGPQGPLILRPRILPPSCLSIPGPARPGTGPDRATTKKKSENPKFQNFGKSKTHQKYPSQLHTSKLLPKIPIKYLQITSKSLPLASSDIPLSSYDFSGASQVLVGTYFKSCLSSFHSICWAEFWAQIFVNLYKHPSKGVSYPFKGPCNPTNGFKNKKKWILFI